MLLPLSLSMDGGEVVDNAVAAVVVPLTAVTVAVVVAVDNEDGVQCWRWGGGRSMPAVALGNNGN